MAHIQLRIDYEEKKAAQEVLEGLGLNLSSAIKLFLKQTVREQKLPFEVSLAPTSRFQNEVEPSGFSSRKIA